MPETNEQARITAREVFDAVQELKSEVRILIQQGRSVEERFKDHETRLRGVEQWRYAIPTTLVLAAASIVTATISAIG